MNIWRAVRRLLSRLACWRKPAGAGGTISINGGPKLNFQSLRVDAVPDDWADPFPFPTATTWTEATLLPPDDRPWERN